MCNPCQTFHLLNNIPLEYFEKAFKWLSKQKSVLKDNYHLMGISKGAELSLLLASHYDEIKGVFAMVPSSVVWQGIPKGMYTGTNSSWTHKNKEIPYVPFGTFDFISLGKGIIYNEWIDYYDNALANAEESSFIKVENIDAPIILTGLAALSVETQKYFFTPFLIDCFIVF